MARHCRKGDFGSPLELFDRGRRGPEPARIRRGGRLTDALSLGNMTEKTDHKRDAPISYRPPAKLRDEFYRRIEASGLPVNAYITKALFDLPTPRGTRRPPIEKEMLALLLARSAAIRDTLDSAARVDGDEAHTGNALKAACEELAVIRAALMKLMERTP